MPIAVMPSWSLASRVGEVTLEVIVVGSVAHPLMEIVDVIVCRFCWLAHWPSVMSQWLLMAALRCCDCRLASGVGY
jgi:hypothetical protein